MEQGEPHYRTYGYMSGRLSFDFMRSAVGKSHDDMIAELRDLVTPVPEITIDLGIYADLFYCENRQVTLLGTWVVTFSDEQDFETVWHNGGWGDRPMPSKENALRYLQQLGRPA